MEWLRLRLRGLGRYAPCRPCLHESPSCGGLSPAVGTSCPLSGPSPPGLRPPSFGGRYADGQSASPARNSRPEVAPCSGGKPLPANPNCRPFGPAAGDPGRDCRTTLPVPFGARGGGLRPHGRASAACRLWLLACGLTLPWLPRRACCPDPLPFPLRLPLPALGAKSHASHHTGETPRGGQRPPWLPCRRLGGPGVCGTLPSGVGARRRTSGGGEDGRTEPRTRAPARTPAACTPREEKRGKRATQKPRVPVWLLCSGDCAIR